jgi:transaldolase
MASSAAIRSGSYTDARRVLDGLAAVGVDYDDVVRALEEDGVTRFQASWTELLHTVAAAMAQHRG